MGRDGGEWGLGLAGFVLRGLKGDRHLENLMVDR